MGDRANNRVTSQHFRTLQVLMLVASLSLLIAACGGGSGSSADSTTSGGGQTSAEFLQPGSKNNKAIVKFGNEAPSRAREEVSEVLMENLEARENGDFATQCATLAKEQLEQIAEAKGANAVSACSTNLAKQAKPLKNSRAVRSNHLVGPIAVLRVYENKAYALFHGNDHKDYAIPMRKESSEWKVASILTITLGDRIDG